VILSVIGCPSYGRPFRQLFRADRHQIRKNES
jgi:hypothetical protein